MNKHEIGQLCKGTPTISVLDNRGLAVREIEFNRAKISDDLDTRITRHTNNVAVILSICMLSIRERDIELNLDTNFLQYVLS